MREEESDGVGDGGTISKSISGGGAGVDVVVVDCC